MYIMRKHLRGKIQKGSSLKSVSPFINYSFEGFSIVFDGNLYKDTSSPLVNKIMEYTGSAIKDTEHFQMVLQFSWDCSRIGVIIKRKHYRSKATKFLILLDVEDEVHIYVQTLLILSRSVILEREFICSDRW